MRGTLGRGLGLVLLAADGEHGAWLQVFGVRACLCMYCWAKVRSGQRRGVLDCINGCDSERWKPSQSFLKKKYFCKFSKIPRQKVKTENSLPNNALRCALLILISWKRKNTLGEPRTCRQPATRTKGGRGASDRPRDRVGACFRPSTRQDG